MQNKLFHLSAILNKYRTVIITLIVLATLLVFLLAPTMLVSAGKAASTGG